MKKIELKIEGMTCGHCVVSVRKELTKLAGVEVEDVRVGGATVRIDETRIDEKRISDAITDAGYALVKASS